MALDNSLERLAAHLSALAGGRLDGVRLDRLFRYAIWGVVNNATCYLIFLLQIWQGVMPVVASGICYVLGVLLAYFGHRFWSFRSTQSHTRDVPAFVVAYLCGLATTLTTISILVLWLPAWLAQILTILASAGVIFSVLTLMRFGGSEQID